MDIEKILEAVEEKNLSIKDVKIEDLIPNEYEGIIIGYIEEEIILFLAKDITGERFKKWKKTRGGVLHHDLKNWKANKSHGKYVLLSENKDIVTIARLIEDNEVKVFDTLKLIDGKIKDKPYMLFRTVKKGEKLTKSDRYIQESDEEMDSDHKIIIPNHISSDEEGSTESGRNVSLFED